MPSFSFCVNDVDVIILSKHSNPTNAKLLCSSSACRESGTRRDFSSNGSYTFSLVRSFVIGPVHFSTVCTPKQLQTLPTANVLPRPELKERNVAFSFSRRARIIVPHHYVSDILGLNRLATTTRLPGQSSVPTRPNPHRPNTPNHALQNTLDISSIFAA